MSKKASNQLLNQEEVPMLQSLPEENLVLTDHSGILNGGSDFEKNIEIKEPAKVLSNNDEERKI